MKHESSHRPHFASAAADTGSPDARSNRAFGGQPGAPSGAQAGAAGSATTRREQYIPLRKDELLEALTADLATTDADRERLTQICRLLEDTFHYQQNRRFREILRNYSEFDPDADTLPVRQAAPRDKARLAPVVCDQVVGLLRQANFRRLDRAEIDAALDAASDWGLRFNVDFDLFAQLEVFVRGDTAVKRARRDWKSLYRRMETEIPIYRRLAVVFRLNPDKENVESDGFGHSAVDPTSVHIKLFKNIPKSDIEMLLPGVRVRMGWFDRGKIILPTVSGIGLTTYKLINGAVTLVFAGLAGSLAALGLIGGTFGYGVKSFLGYLRTKDKYQLCLTRNLYYQNLDNNAGAIHRLLAEAEEQDLREVLLGYFLLWREAGPEGWTTLQLDAAAESFLENLLGESIDFEIGDAVHKLERLELVDATPGHRWRAVPLHEAWHRLRRRWLELPAAARSAEISPV